MCILKFTLGPIIFLHEPEVLTYNWACQTRCLKTYWINDFKILQNRFVYRTFPSNFLHVIFLTYVSCYLYLEVLRIMLSMHDFFLKLIILFVSHFIVESFSRSHPFDTMSSLLDSMSKHYIEVGTWGKRKTKSTMPHSRINLISGFILKSLFTFLLISIRVNQQKTSSYMEIRFKNWKS